eukprot:TRINITY_DN4312_c0_g1_i1.p1 TRINITY_DN4312_c0_g1~~TRINITY_DN4312_c0_g1_i1.p1  ORF type:complete len:260 (-),score=57.25 TRINITY_DN4312_c0_g1_i1:1444-2223(-)
MMEDGTNVHHTRRTLSEALSEFKKYCLILRDNTTYHIWWWAGVISQLGDWLNEIACVTIIGYTSKSGLLVATLTMCKNLPMFFLSPVAGVVADSFDRRKVMIVSDLIRAVIVLFFLFSTSSRLWLLFLLQIILASVSSFYRPASESLMTQLVDSSYLIVANSLGELTWSMMLFLGAAAGGVITSIFGTTVNFLVDSATFILSAVLVARILHHTLQPIDQQGDYMMVEKQQGDDKESLIQTADNNNKVGHRDHFPTQITS